MGIYNKKKSIQEAKKLHKKQQRELLKQGAINYIFIWLNLIIINMIAAASALPPQPSILPPPPPQFNIGNYVYSIPESSSGVDRRQAEAFYGCISELFFDQTWNYNIQSMHDGRNCLWLPEARVRSMSRSIEYWRLSHQDNMCHTIGKLYWIGFNLCIRNIEWYFAQF